MYQKKKSKRIRIPKDLINNCLNLMEMILLSTMELLFKFNRDDSNLKNF